MDFQIMMIYQLLGLFFENKNKNKIDNLLKNN